ncbi:MAG: hypothetical protein ACYC7D_14015 [Nitrososphaerales archaeon]
MQTVLYLEEIAKEKSFAGTARISMNVPAANLYYSLKSHASIGLNKFSRRVLALAVILAIVLGLAVEYTLLKAPTILEVQSSGALQNSIISVSKSYASANMTDGSGSYGFRFGFDYPDTPIQAGSATVFKVYAALTSEKISSFFTRGVSLQVQSGSLLVDGRYDSGVKVVTSTQHSLETILFEFVNANLPAGSHNASARLVVSSVDVDYLGYFDGSTQVVLLNGTFSITG